MTYQPFHKITDDSELIKQLSRELSDNQDAAGTELKEETAKELIKRGVDMDIIAGATGISREELEKMASKVQ